MRSLRSEQARRGLSHKRRAQEQIQTGLPGDVLDFDPLSGLNQLKSREIGLPAVPETSKQDSVWRRLGELALHMRQNGVAEHKIQDLLKYHTPGQIELAFQKMPKVHPDAVADVVLNGRFGYRAGIKKNKQPPNTKAAQAFLKQEKLKEAKCPVVTAPRLQGLLEDFLEGLSQ